MARGVMPRRPGKSGRQERVVGSRGPVTGLKKPTANTKARARLEPPAKAAASPRKKAKSVGKYDPLAPARVHEILRRLDERYPNVVCALRHRSAWELVVATILSAQCTDVRVNIVTPGLFAKYPTVRHFAALKPEELEPDIRSTGFFRNKSKSVVGAAKRVVSEFGGEVPAEMEKLLTLPGVARKTANVVLGSWFGRNDGVVVDTHVTRISRRLELTKQTDAVKIERDLMQVVPKEHWTLFSHQIIHHGRSLCVARGPKCAECPLEALCHAVDKTWSTVETHADAR